jgi:hypothetical protein
MAYYSRHTQTPAADQIIEFLTRKAHQSAIDISNDTGFTYWHCRNVAAKLVRDGKLIMVLVGKSPHYSLAPVQTPETGAN